MPGPACVGKTRRLPYPPCRCRKHPHVRGEDVTATIAMICNGETPPRAWGNRPRRNAGLFLCRNTPTHVGKTQPHGGNAALSEKHPHARGEDPESFLPVRMTPLATWAIFGPLPTKYMPGWLRARFQGMGEGGTWLSGKRSLPIERFPPSRGRCLRIGLAGGTAARCPRRFSSAFRAAMPAFFHPHWWKKPRCTGDGPISLFHNIQLYINKIQATAFQSAALFKKPSR